MVDVKQIVTMNAEIFWFARRVVIQKFSMCFQFVPLVLVEGGESIISRLEDRFEGMPIVVSTPDVYLP